MTKEETLKEVRSLIINNIKELTSKMEKDEISAKGFQEKADKLMELDENVVIYFEREYIPLFV